MWAHAGKFFGLMREVGNDEIPGPLCAGHNRKEKLSFAFHHPPALTGSRQRRFPMGENRHFPCMGALLDLVATHFHAEDANPLWQGRTVVTWMRTATKAGSADGPQ
jgi:hypothetical protein